MASLIHILCVCLFVLKTRYCLKHGASMQKTTNWKIWFTKKKERNIGLIILFVWFFWLNNFWFLFHLQIYIAKLPELRSNSTAESNSKAIETKIDCNWEKLHTFLAIEDNYNAETHRSKTEMVYSIAAWKVFQCP